MELSELGRFRENNRLEAKEAQGRDGNGALPRSIWETLSAFANTSGGVIVLGVKEHPDKSLEVIGIGDPDKVLDDFWNAALSKDKVSTRFMRDSDATIEDVDGKRVIVIRVPWADRHSRPIYIDDDLFGGTFRRTHTGDHLCSHEEVLSMLRDSDTSSQDANIAQSAGVDRLNRETVRRYRSRFDQRNEGHVWSSESDEDFLESIGALRREGGELRPTCAGLLMFGEDRWISQEFPHYFLDYREETDDDTRWEDRFTSQTGDWTGNVYDFYFRAYNKLKAALKVPFRLEGIDRVDDTPAHEALREALANCLTNTNWFERRGVVCVWSDEAITIANPGDFRMPVEEAMKPGRSDPRNETMMKMFSLVDIGERAGSGMDKIFRGWGWAGYARPSYDVEFGPDRTTLRLPLVAASGYSSGYSSTGRNDRTNRGGRANSSANRKADILAFLGEHGATSRREVSEMLGVGKSRTSELLSDLLADGDIVADGAGRNRTYSLADSRQADDMQHAAAPDPQ